LNKNGRIFSGNGRDTDTLVASAIAYIAAINKMVQKEKEDLEGGR